MSSPNIVFKEKSQFELKFDLENLHPSYVNGLRRVILNNVETIGFKTEPYDQSEINIIENTSSLHNEFLLHRIGMIPIKYPNPDSFDPDKYQFILDVENKSLSEIINITTKDFKVIDTSTGTQMDTNIFFPPNPDTKEYILITKLKPNPSGSGEKIKLEGKASKNSGELNARYSPVSCVTFINKRDPEKVIARLNEMKQEMSEAHDGTPEQLAEKIRVMERRFMIMDADRLFIIDSNGNPSHYEFTLESCGVLNSSVILNKAIYMLNTIINRFLVNFERAVEENNDIITIEKSDSNMNAYDIIIQNENHTLGNLLQSYILETDDTNNVDFVAYNLPHPLKNFIKLRISVKDDTVESVKNHINKAISYINNINKVLRDRVEREFPETKGATIVLKRKKKSS